MQRNRQFPQRNFNGSFGSRNSIPDGKGICGGIITGMQSCLCNRSGGLRRKQPAQHRSARSDALQQTGK